MSIRLKCKAVKEMFKKENYYIIAFEPITPYPSELKLSKYFNFSCCGEYPFITIGREYDMIIEELKTDKYGTSYSIISVPSLDEQDLHNLSREEAFEIMQDITSSDRIANNVLDAYPQFIEIVLTDGQEAIDTKLIKGVGNAYLSAYVRNITNKYKYYHIIKKLTDYKIDITDCKNLLSEFKDEQGIQKALKDKPYYVLIENLGRGFEQVDKLLMEVRPELNDSKQRCEALMMTILRLNEQSGSTRLSGNILYRYMRDEYNTPQLLPLVKDVAMESDIIYYDEKSKDLAVRSTYLGELKIADFIKEKLDNSKKLDIDIEKYRNIGEFSLSDMQMQGLQNFCDSNISIIAGYSGSGKSQSAKGLVQLMEDNGLSYLLLSSTGKASKVLSESCSTPTKLRRAYTVHKKCYEGDINVDCILCDEAGMLALDTMCMLVNAISNPNMRIVMFGDPSQLSSVGLSKVFEDLINCGKIPTTMLTEVFRYKSNGSLFVATNVRNGISFFDDKEMCKYSDKDNSFSVCNNYKFIQKEDDEIIDTLIEEYRKLLKKGIKPKDIMILSSMNVRSLGTYSINNALQAEFNPPKPNELYLERTIKSGNENVTIIYRKNDVVINTKNDYRAVSYDAYQEMEKSDGKLEEEDVADSFIVNGQLGVVVNVMTHGMVVNFDDELIYVSKHKLKNILLGTAISVHRSQGSSIDYTISVIGKSQSKMITRGMLYVEMTRCRKSHIDIGDIQTLVDGLDIVDNDLRNTFLKEMMEDELER